MKNTHGGVLLLVTLQAGCFHVFRIIQLMLNCAAHHIYRKVFDFSHWLKNNMFYNPSFFLPHTTMSQTFANFCVIWFSQKRRERVTQPRSILLWIYFHATWLAPIICTVLKVVGIYMWCYARFAPFVQFKKRKKHPWKSVTLSKAAGFILQLYWK